MTEITARLSTALADRYKIERHLGEGGMATVYLAEDLKHHRKVAIKVLRPEIQCIVQRLSRTNPGGFLVATQQWRSAEPARRTSR